MDFTLRAYCVVLFCLLFPLFPSAQSSIKFGNQKINRLDKQKKKQGDWIFLDEAGNVSFTCFYKDDSLVSNVVFYEQTDTAFVLAQRKDNKQDFIIYHKGIPYVGLFQYSADSIVSMVLPDVFIEESIRNRIKKYQLYTSPPRFVAEKQSLRDYIAAGMRSSDMMINKSVYVVVSVSASGLITHVDFPRDKNNLSADEEREFRWIYESMPRWQPAFRKGRTVATSVVISNNNRLEWGNSIFR